ncbi:DDE-type integrase/transposase/recombinase [Brevundimonas sp.]|uniref:DDE-type integrase/transposase/recombinase n=1 Tax=Brevundimonas sp. TaxID=1871086 RepID=UPI00272FAF5A|nr:DDE-type integrase/transposase/recombinase [Brevundimonas sp.]MDP1912049.1 DDE-type integrase/transposase/recombinase [Brevundimonas sp.]
MADKTRTSHERWAHLRFSVVGTLLAAPPGPGELKEELQKLAGKTWQHPVTGEPTRFGFATIERWYYLARNAGADPVAVLRKRIRKDSGQQSAMGEKLKAALVAQYLAHRAWSYQLHADNLAALAARDAAALGAAPSYATVRRYMKATGLFKRRRLSSRETKGALAAERRLEEREVRSYENAYVNGLWHLDFHHGSRKVVTPAGEWLTPILLGILDDKSRLACHLQWYFAETAENLVHGLSQAIQKRGLPRSLMTDNGKPMDAAETRGGLARLGIHHQTTLPYSPYQNGKQENFWGQVEGRLVAMLEGVRRVTLALMNEATQAWVELEYNRKTHSELGTAPIHRYLEGPDVGRKSPDSRALRLAFCTEELRTQRRSDGTFTLEGVRFEVPSQYRHFERVTVRYARWDMTHVFLVDDKTSTVLSALYPLDRNRNADGQRKSLDVAATESTPGVPAPEVGVAPLLERLMTQYAAGGLPPAYLPKDDSTPQSPKDNE